MLSGTFFFLSDEIIVQTRQVANIMSVISDLGGMIESLILCLSLFFLKYNDLKFLTKSIRSVYLDSDKKGVAKPFKMSWFDLVRSRIQCLKNTKPNIRTAEILIKEDLNLLRMVQQIKKL